MKPDREIYELVNNRFCKLDGQSGTDLKMRMAEYAHVGDSEIRDYWGSLRAGCGRSFLLKPCIKCKDRSLEECKDAFYTPCCSDSFTSWVYSHSNASRSLGKIPSRHIVNSLTELASLVTFQNNSRPHDDTKQWITIIRFCILIFPLKVQCNPTHTERKWISVCYIFQRAPFDIAFYSAREPCSIRSVSVCCITTAPSDRPSITNYLLPKMLCL